ncbi:FMN-binding protein [candidate division KSB1 bacterium]|nr:FMN-binding protein [candidate division KSB1 bacterium]
MKKSITTIAFMTFVTVLFISVLAVINETSRARIIQNLQIDEAKSILYAFDILPKEIDETELNPAATTNDLPWNEQNVIETIREEIKTVTLPISEEHKKLLKDSFLAIEDSATIYIHHDNSGNVLAYGFPLKGKGLWGTISAFGAVSSNLEKMVGIDFTAQVETPGLGARITEVEFKYFFRNLSLEGFHEDSKRKPIVLVKEKEQSNIEDPTNSLQAITGATQTVSGVQKMLNTDLKFYLDLIKENEQQLKQAVSQRA